MRAVGKKIHTATSRYKRKRRLNRGTGTYMPLPQQAEAKKLYASGKTIAEVARELNKNWRTIAKVVRTEDMERYLDEMEKQLAEMIPDALNTLQSSLKVGKHKAQLSYGLVRDYILRRRQRQGMQQVVPMTVQATMEQQDEKAVKETIAAFAEMAIETHRIFGLEMPEMELVKKPTKKVEMNLTVN